MKELNWFQRLWLKVFPPKWITLEPDENGTFHVSQGD